MIPQNKQIKELETEKNSHRATFKLGDEIGWRRIAKIGESILNARFYISTYSQRHNFYDFKCNISKRLGALVEYRNL